MNHVNQIRCPWCERVTAWNDTVNAPRYCHTCNEPLLDAGNQLPEAVDNFSRIEDARLRATQALLSAVERAMPAPAIAVEYASAVEPIQIRPRGAAGFGQRAAHNFDGPGAA